MDIVDKGILEDIALPTDVLNFYFIVQQIVFYVVALTIVISCVCLCILLIKKVIKALPKNK